MEMTMELQGSIAGAGRKGCPLSAECQRSGVLMGAVHTAHRKDPGGLQDVDSPRFVCSRGGCVSPTSWRKERYLSYGRLAQENVGVYANTHNIPPSPIL